MKNRNVIQIGGLFFLIGFILITISWYYTYPIHISPIDEVAFSQFFPSLWPGIIFCSIGIFLIGYYTKNKIVQVVFCCFSPLLLYITPFFYSYLSQSDSGSVRSMFLIFQKVNVNPHVVSYFEFPNFFVLNEILHQAVGVDEKGIAFISYALYGVLLALFLFLIFSKLMGQKYNQISFLLVIIYFIGMFSFLNYQWVPQTLALVYFFLFVFISTYLFSEPLSVEWKFLILFIFLSLVFSHPFIPLVALLFFGILSIKKRYLVQLFLFIITIYIFFTLYYSMINFDHYVEALRQSILGFGREYTTSVSRSFIQPEDTMSQFISNINRIRIPLIYVFASIGTLFLLFKRKIGFHLQALFFAGGIYLVTGIFYSILGLRTLQILFVPLTIGFTFFIFKWKKLTLFVIFIILISAVFGSIRMAYNETQFQTDGEAKACNFLADNFTTVENVSRVATNQVDYGYFTNIYFYLKNAYPNVKRPGEKDFFNLFNKSMNINDYIIYNSNLGKEILTYGTTMDRLLILLKDLTMYNKIYDCGQTYIIKGTSPS
jgi:hypothetical protein